MNRLKNNTQFLFAIFFMLLFSSCQTQTILFEHIGYQDKPMPSVIIKRCVDSTCIDSIGKYCLQKKPFVYEYFVGKKQFDALVSFAAENATNKRFDKGTDNTAYGTYRVLISGKTKNLLV